MSNNVARLALHDQKQIRHSRHTFNIYKFSLIKHCSEGRHISTSGPSGDFVWTSIKVKRLTYKFSSVRTGVKKARTAVIKVRAVVIKVRAVATDLAFVTGGIVPAQIWSFGDEADMTSVDLKTALPWFMGNRNNMVKNWYRNWRFEWELKGKKCTYSNEHL